LAITSDRFQICGLKRFVTYAATTSLVGGEWLNLTLDSQKILPEEIDQAIAAIIFAAGFWIYGTLATAQQSLPTVAFNGAIAFR
jgi:hypothetical protein